MITNNNPALRTIDLSHNLIEDKGKIMFFLLLLFSLNNLFNYNNNNINNKLHKMINKKKIKKQPKTQLYL